MTHRSLLGQDAEDLRIVRKLKFATMQITLAADNFVITPDMPTAMTIDPAGTKEIIMPDETDIDNIGLAFLIRNGANAAEDLTVRNSADDTTVGTISQGESAWVVLMPVIAGGSTYTWTVATNATT